MEKEGRNRERMRKCRESISLHFLAARMPQFVQPCPAYIVVEVTMAMAEYGSQRSDQPEK